MTDNPEATDEVDNAPPERLSKKEFAKKMRREAYLRAKEYRKTDLRQIAMMEKLKQQRRDAYQKSKERWKIVKAERKNEADGKVAEDRVAKQKNLMAKLVPASSIKTPANKRTP
ncbi:MAG: hypothetical protein HY077_00050 [Elusimicrobia bacterium]|nr:hypothetical protein [Elusimicrobiota bacterium]